MSSIVKAPSVGCAAAAAVVAEEEGASEVVVVAEEEWTRTRRGWACAPGCAGSSRDGKGWGCVGECACACGCGCGCGWSWSRRLLLAAPPGL